MRDSASNCRGAQSRTFSIIGRRTANNQITVLVSDTGRCIAKTDLLHIFDRFYRADPSRSETEGSGLGLAIAKWITKMHHAQLTVASKVCKGTVFQLVFPATVMSLRLMKKLQITARRAWMDETDRNHGLA